MDALGYRVYGKAKRTVDLTIARLSQYFLLEAGLALDAHGVDDAVGMLGRALETADVLAYNSQRRHYIGIL
jgi:hypothetical protein